MSQVRRHRSDLRNVEHRTPNPDRLLTLILSSIAEERQTNYELKREGQRAKSKGQKRRTPNGPRTSINVELSSESWTAVSQRRPTIVGRLCQTPASSSFHYSITPILPYSTSAHLLLKAWPTRVRAYETGLLDCSARR